MFNWLDFIQIVSPLALMVVKIIFVKVVNFDKDIVTTAGIWTTETARTICSFKKI